MTLEDQFAADRTKFINHDQSKDQNPNFHRDAGAIFALLFEGYPDIISQVVLQLPENADYLTYRTDRGESIYAQIFTWLQNKLSHTESSDEDIDLPFLNRVIGRRTKGFLEAGKTDHKLSLWAFHYTYTPLLCRKRATPSHGFLFLIAKRTSYGDVPEKVLHIHPKKANFFTRIFSRRKNHPSDFLTSFPIKIDSRVHSAEEIIADIKPFPTPDPGTRARLAA